MSFGAGCDALPHLCGSHGTMLHMGVFSLLQDVGLSTHRRAHDSDHRGGSRFRRLWPSCFPSGHQQDATNVISPVDPSQLVVDERFRGRFVKQQGLLVCPCLHASVARTRSLLVSLQSVGLWVCGCARVGHEECVCFVPPKHVRGPRQCLTDTGQKRRGPLSTST